MIETKEKEEIESINLDENSNPLDELKDIIKQFNITNVISYDDEWGEINNNTSFENSFLDISINEFVSKYAIDINKEQDDLISNEGFLTIRELLSAKNEELKPVIEQIKVFANSGERSKKVLSNLKDLLDELKESDIINYSLKNEKYSSEHVKGIAGRILFIIDINMEKIREEKDVIIDTILNINKSRHGNLDIIVIYSYEDLSAYKNHESKIQYVKNVLTHKNELLKEFKELEKETQEYLLPFQLWALKKTGERDELIKGFLSTLKKAAFGHSLHDYLYMKIKNVEKAMFELIKISEEKFEFLYKDSFIEGEIFLDILDRVTQSLISKVAFEGLDDSFNKKVLNNILLVAKEKNKSILDDIRSMGSKAVRKYREEIRKNKVEKETFKNISEFALIDYSVNKTYHNIVSGDIFSIDLYDSEKTIYGILITPSCDLVIRYSGDQPSEGDIKRNAKVASLLLCEGTELTIDHESIKKTSNGLWPIKCFIQDKYYIIEPTAKSDIINIDIRVLDLCSLDEDGWAKLKPDENKFKEFKTFFFGKYFNNDLKPWLDKITDLSMYIPHDSNIKDMVAATNEGIDDPAKKCEEQLVDVLVGLKYSIKLNRTNDRFEIRRIGCLEMRHTFEIIQKKFNQASRVGTMSPPLA